MEIYTNKILELSFQLVYVMFEGFSLFFFLFNCLLRFSFLEILYY